METHQAPRAGACAIAFAKQRADATFVLISHPLAPSHDVNEARTFLRRIARPPIGHRRFALEGRWRVYTRILDFAAAREALPAIGGATDLFAAWIEFLETNPDIWLCVVNAEGSAA